MQYWQEVLAGLKTRFRFVTAKKNGGIFVSEYKLAPDVKIGSNNTLYTARGFYKPAGKTLSEKLLRNMEKELETDENMCYTVFKSQKGLDCKQERSIV
jgi:hypothetical protein